MVDVLGHSYVMIDILKENNFKKFAEIGVWKSGTTRIILDKLSDQIEEYWAVDPWEVMSAGTRTELNRTKWHWDEYHKYACCLMLRFPQLRIIRATSEQASTIFPDGYFDMVYIDAIHTFEYVYADIGYWLPKVRKGGLLGGHDYGSPRFPGVKKAVHKRFGKEGIKVWKDMRQQVWIKRV